MRATDLNPQQLERVDERLFGLRALARKHGTDVDSLASLTGEFAAKIERIDDADRDISRLETEVSEAQRDTPHFPRNCIMREVRRRTNWIRP